MKTYLPSPYESGGNRDGARCTACHAFRLVIEPLDERAGVRVGSRRVEDHLIGIIAGATPLHYTGSAKNACWITSQEMIFVRIIDPPLKPPIMRQFARLRGELRHTGQIIGDFDILIAATALPHHLTLVTGHT